MELLKMLSANEVVAQIVSFLILLTLLRVFAWKKILKLLDDRKEKIASEFKGIDSAKADIAKLKSDYEAKLANIDAEAKNRIDEAIERGKKITEEVRKKANEAAQDIIDNGKKSIGYELAKAKEELKDTIIDLTIKTTESMIEEKMTAESDRALVKKFLEKLDKAE
jgi:F-type H+-transporting ATPase subunit b